MCQQGGSASGWGAWPHVYHLAGLPGFVLAGCPTAFPGEGKSMLSLLSPDLGTYPSSLCLILLAKAAHKAS